jgi:hypothetical protein
VSVLILRCKTVPMDPEDFRTVRYVPQDPVQNLRIRVTLARLSAVRGGGGDGGGGEGGGDGGKDAPPLQRAGGGRQVRARVPALRGDSARRSTAGWCCAGGGQTTADNKEWVKGRWCFSRAAAARLNAGVPPASACLPPKLRFARHLGQYFTQDAAAAADRGPAAGSADGSSGSGGDAHGGGEGAGGPGSGLAAQATGAPGRPRRAVQESRVFGWQEKVYSRAELEAARKDAAAAPPRPQSPSRRTEALGSQPRSGADQLQVRRGGRRRARAAAAPRSPSPPGGGVADSPRGAARLFTPRPCMLPYFARLRRARASAAALRG